MRLRGEEKAGWGVDGGGASDVGGERSFLQPSGLQRGVGGGGEGELGGVIIPALPPAGTEFRLELQERIHDAQKLPCSTPRQQHQNLLVARRAEER